MCFLFFVNFFFILVVLWFFQFLRFFVIITAAELIHFGLFYVFCLLSKLLIIFLLICFFYFLLFEFSRFCIIIRFVSLSFILTIKIVVIKVLCLVLIGKLIELKCFCIQTWEPVKFVWQLITKEFWFPHIVFKCHLLFLATKIWNSLWKRDTGRMLIFILILRTFLLGM